MRRAPVGALALGAGLMAALAGCAAPGAAAVDLCTTQMDANLEASDGGTATAWEGGIVDDRVYEYSAVLTLDGVDIAVSCLVTTTPDGLRLQDFDAEPAD